MGIFGRHCAALSFLSFLSLGAAAGNPCSTTTTLSELAVPSAVAACPYFTGDIVFEKVTPTATTATVAFSSLSTLYGSLLFVGAQAAASRTRKSDSTPGTTGGPPHKEARRASGTGGRENPDLSAKTVTIYAPNLGEITGELRFMDLNWDISPEFTSLNTAYDLVFSNVNFASKTTKFGIENFKALQFVQSLLFDQTNVGHIGLQFPLDPPTDLGADVVASITAMNNVDLQSISLSGLNSFANVAIDIGANSAHPSVEFSNLTVASLNLAGVGAFEAPLLSKLITQSGQPTQKIASNLFATLSPKSLNVIQGTLEIASNQKLAVLDLSGLQSAGDLKVRDNTALKTITIGRSATGDISVDSAGSVNCEKLKAQVPSANVACPSGTPISSSGGSAGGASSGSSGGGGLSAGAKTGIGVGVALGALILLGAVIFFCLRSRKQSARNKREVSTGAYSKSPHSFGGSEEVTYTKVPYHSGSQGEMQQQAQGRQEFGGHNMMATGWSHSEQNVKPGERSVELEEQQGMRHEMDARSLPDMDSDEDEEAETRSLEDIERVHQQR